MDADNNVVIARGREVEGGGRGSGRINVDGWRLDLGGEHTGQYTDDVL